MESTLESAGKWDLFCAEQMGRVVARLTNGDELVDKVELAERIAEVCEKSDQGTFSSVARLAGINKNVLWCWLRDGRRPSLEHLLRVAAVVQVGIDSLFFRTGSSTSVADVLPKKFLPPALARRRSEFDLIKAERVLQTAIARSSGASLKRLAKELEIVPRDLKKKLPDLCRELVVRNTELTSKALAIREKKTLRAISELRRKFERRGIFLSRRQLQSELEKQGLTLGWNQRLLKPDSN